MAKNAIKVTQSYLEAVAELEKIIENAETDEQIETAENSMNDLTVMLGTYSVQQIEGRTALLNGLIVELAEVIAAVQSNPIGDSLDKLTGIFDSAKVLLKAEKKKLSG
jgi:hypothetical protein